MALLTGDLQATGCVGSASRFIATQNVPVRTVIWLFKKPTFYVFARPEIKTGADLKDKTIGISSFASDTDLSMKIFAQLHKLDPEKRSEARRQRFDEHPARPLLRPEPSTPRRYPLRLTFSPNRWD